MRLDMKVERVVERTENYALVLIDGGPISVLSLQNLREAGLKIVQADTPGQPLDFCHLLFEHDRMNKEEILAATKKELEE